MAVSRSSKLNPKNISHDTVSRILNQTGLKYCTSIPKTVSEANMAKRLKLAASDFDWTQVVFSDESDLFPEKQGKNHFRKYRGEVLDVNFGPQYRWDPRKVKVWGSISYEGVGKLIRYEGTMNGEKY